MLEHSKSIVIGRSEFEMSLNRFVFCLLIGIYLLATHSPGLSAELAYIVGYSIFSLALFLWIRCDPALRMSRATLALIGDFATISFEMHLGGASTSVFYPIYLWVILGNGFRFGLRFLFAAMIAALVGFGLVCRTTPFWLHETYLCWGLFVGLIIVPGYGATLIAKLSTARREAEAANRAKSLFLASVSHSVRTPLNAILASINLLKDTSLNEEQEELIQKLGIGANMLMSLITGILDFTQIEANRMPVRLVATDVARLVVDLRSLLASQARAKGVRLSAHVGRSVPDRVLSDPRHLHEILVNLASNALKFTETGSIVLAVTAVPLTDGQLRLSIRVSDTGIGIKEDALDRIFDRFTQADGTIVDRFGGTGLGLAIVRSLVHLLGGTIDVESTFGKGSIFTVTLDCMGAEARMPDAHPPRHRIVLLSPDAPVSALARHMAALGVPVELVTTAPDLVSACRETSASTSRPVVLLDCPSQDARSRAIAMLEALDPWSDLPRLLVTDGIDPEEMVRIEPHVTSLLGSGFDIETLRAALCVCLGPAPDAVIQLHRSDVQDMRGLDILVADDNLTNQRLIKKILERAGHRPHLVQNGEDAVIALTERRFDLALLDLNMPVMTGLEAAREYGFLSLGRDSVPLIALTADATPETARQCLEAGMVDCITKPVAPDALIERIRALMATSSSSSASAPSSTVSDIRLHPQFKSVLPHLDPQSLADLEALGGAEFAAELLDGFVVEARALAEQLAQAAADRNLFLFRSHAHGLRSAAANVGACVVHDLCGQCRNLAADRLGVDGAALSRRIKVALDSIGQQLSDHGKVG